MRLRQATLGSLLKKCGTGLEPVFAPPGSRCHTTLVEVDPRTLAILIGSSVLRAWLGADGVSRLPRLPIQIRVRIVLIIPAVLIAAFIVKSLDLDTLRWLVVIAAAYTAVMMLRSAARGDQSDASLAVELPVEESK